jgi:hypothetical protein
MIRTLLLAAALAVAAVTPSWSGAAPIPPPPPPPPPTPPHAVPQPGPGAGPWVTGGMMVSAFSLIVCGVWECNATHNEMSNQEAVFSAVVPFGCFWWRQHFSKDHGPTCSNYRKP